ncbi:MAG: hypothetical protein KF726_00540 [Anaerolineae bacterium]|nr:hypothetical protein [Anaerolineae bacterium]
MNNTRTSAGTTLLYRFLLILVLCCLSYVAVVIADLILHPNAPEVFFNSVLFRITSGLIIAPITIGVGLLIIRRTDRNVVGPLLILWGAGIATWSLRQDIDVATFAVLNTLFGSLAWNRIMLLGLYFPTGRFVPQRGNNLIALLTLLNLVCTVLTIPASETLLINRVNVPNPVFIPLLSVLGPVVQLLSAVSILLLPVMIYSLYWRFKHAQGRERQQLKWLFWSFALFIASTPISLAVANNDNLLARIVNLLLFIWYYLFPTLGISNAILRYRLYDIDIIIRRTLIYSILTGILALLFFGGVTIVQQLFRAVTGQTSDLAIVISTLAIAALFTPLRQRLQHLIDRRLYRRKYDAEKTLDQFGQTLRDETDLNVLKASMISVVQDTMQPTTIALWTRPFRQTQTQDESR